jgi:hypothetical protein
MNRSESSSLISVIRALDPAIQQCASLSVNDNPFNKLLVVDLLRNRCYVGLLSALSKQPTWYGNLDRHGHFKNCLAIADTLSSQLQTDLLNVMLAVPLTAIFANVDDMGEDHEFLRAVDNI